MRYLEFSKLCETATSGGTSAGNVAVVTQQMTRKKKKPIGIGFDPDGDKGIYDSKPVMIQRIQTKTLP